MSYKWEWSTPDKPARRADKMLKEAEKRLPMVKAEYNNARDKHLLACKKENRNIATNNNLWVFIVLFVMQLVSTLISLYLYFNKQAC